MKTILFFFFLCFLDGNFFSQTLKTVKIGSQIWTSTNLNVAKFSNGESIPQAKNQSEWKKANDDKTPVWCYYEYKAENGVKYGRLYNWYAVSDARGLAPKGYEIPDSSDWNQLIKYCGGIMVAGKKLKSISGWSNKGNATAPNGFNGLPGGFVIPEGSCHGLGTSGGWWASTAEGENSATVRYLEAEKNTSEAYPDFKSCGFSVRCIKLK